MNSSSINSKRTHYIKLVRALIVAVFSELFIMLKNKLHSGKKIYPKHIADKTKYTRILNELNESRNEKKKLHIKGE